MLQEVRTMGKMNMVCSTGRPAQASAQ